MIPTALLPLRKAKLSIITVFVALLLFVVSMHNLTVYAQHGGAATGGNANSGAATDGSSTARSVTITGGNCYQL